jgi:2-methylcitrate dehydratase PrpD
VARQCILDTLGCAVAAHQAKPAGADASELDNVALLRMLEAELISQARQYDPGFTGLLQGGASIWGGSTEGLKPLKLNTLDAALLNGTGSHTLDFDDGALGCLLAFWVKARRRELMIALSPRVSCRRLVINRSLGNVYLI